jgi:L-fucose isomerase
MLFGHLLTSGMAQVFADVRTYWSPEAVKRVTGYQLDGHAKNGIIHLINSGAAALDATGRCEINNKPAMKPFYEITDKEAQACLDNTKWGAASLGYFRGGGFSSTFLSRGGMPVTMSRMNIVDGLGPVMQIAEGWTCDIDPKAHEILNMRTDPTWPTTYFAPRLTGEGAFTSVYDVMAKWGANHGVLSYGHIGNLLITMCSMLRIPVNMHNVETDKVYRPSAWASFGTSDLEGADYRACRNFGPLYK